MGPMLRSLIPMNGLYREGWGDEIRLRVLSHSMVSLELIGRNHGDRRSMSPMEARFWLRDRGYEKVSD